MTKDELITALHGAVQHTPKSNSHPRVFIKSPDGSTFAPFDVEIAYCEDQGREVYTASEQRDGFDEECIVIWTDKK